MCLRKKTIVLILLRPQTYTNNKPIVTVLTTVTCVAGNVMKGLRFIARLTEDAAAQCSREGFSPLTNPPVLLWIEPRTQSYVSPEYMSPGKPIFWLLFKYLL